MDSVLECNQLRSRNIHLINYCRRYLQLHTTADVATAEGVHVDLCFITGHVSVFSSRSKDPEIHQECPCTPDAWTERRKACSLLCTSPSVHGSFAASVFADFGTVIGTIPLADFCFEPQRATLPTSSSPGVQKG